MAGPGFSDADFTVTALPLDLNTPPEFSPKAQKRKLQPINTNHNKSGSWNSLIGIIEHGLLIPASPNGKGHHVIEVPATQSPDAHAQQYMNTLSQPPSMKEPGLSRNSFGASLPILRSKHGSRLSNVTTADVQEALSSPPTLFLGDELAPQFVSRLRGRTSPRLWEPRF
ncbi:hypothetical protein B0T25DRAFT_568048 [Lasiosphaeria hispida]|uniref:Uncharacterized protein n=1 Tax=Lasiosphaeria hispida TaxID=260671 RepID=A0AAJ0HHG7_9PEZI|nr:hypothetical protein B0T25DRAFT_568048 [Lasiosphaeria hispida]